ncbi:MAG: ATP-binding protein [Acidobacteriaceae bacterium]
MPRLIPRTIRGQLILGTALLQCLLVTAVFWYVYRQQRANLRVRTAERLTYQVHLLSAAITPQMRNQRIGDVQSILDGMLSAPTIRAVRVTDLYGNTLAYSDRRSGAEYTGLSAAERRQLRPSYIAKIFDNGNKGLVAVADINIDNTPVALAWVYPDISEDQVDLSSLLRSALLFALLAIAANVLFSTLIARSVTRPLRGLLRGTKLLIREPERGNVFPLKTSSMNEAGELTRSFNTMVASLNEQRAGLNDTLALLDSMLANAPIGFAFFDRKLRYVRVNQFLAEMDQVSISRHLGRSVEDVFPDPMGSQLSAAIEQVFSTAAPVRDLELHPRLASMPEPPRTWLASFYPVRIGSNEAAGDRNLDERAGDGRAGERPPNASRAEQVRWVGAFVIDTTERKLSEEMLRRTEKLAATGRLAASIAHEINNPLGAITNLLYLLHEQPLDPESLQYAEMAQQQIARVSQITQQTLRFYRQSSRPEHTNLAELLDSVLDLHQGRLNATRINVIRRYRAAPELFAFAGEMRQIFANLVGNAVDAMPKGGRLIVSVRESRAWNLPQQHELRGLRIVIADTGSGMNEAVKKHIFDAFFTTKETTGTGLGLWISSEIIAKHKGTICVRSRPWQHRTGEGEMVAPTELQPAGLASGTVFMLFFPLESDASRSWREHGNQDTLTSDNRADRTRSMAES